MPDDPNSKSEEDVHDDPHVAGSRAVKADDDNNGGDTDAGDDSYVGRTGSDDSIDAGETGAEARSQDG